jgi:hypothetical protein
MFYVFSELEFIVPRAAEEKPSAANNEEIDLEGRKIE